MNHNKYIAKADKLKDSTAQDLAALSLDCLDAWKEEFSTKFPRLHGKITFGMGTVSVGSNNRIVYNYEGFKSLETLFDTIETIEEICNNYILACPDDYEF